MTNQPPDLLPGTLDMLILRTLGRGRAARLRDRRTHPPGVRRRAGGRRELAYPALQRLLVNGWVTAEWGASDNNRRARYYTLTAAGASVWPRSARSSSA